VSRPQTARPAPVEQLPPGALTATSSVDNKKYGSKDDIDFIKHNQKVAKSAQLKRAPSIEQLKSVQEKLNKDLEAYNNKIKGKIPK
jgi:hypothetical protein